LRELAKAYKISPIPPSGLIEAQGWNVCTVCQELQSPESFLLSPLPYSFFQLLANACRCDKLIDPSSVEDINAISRKHDTFATRVWFHNDILNQAHITPFCRGHQYLHGDHTDNLS
jgi:hypothetical protein